jgi:hypothetical protein
MLDQVTGLAKRVIFRGGSPYYYARKYIQICGTPGEFMERRQLAAVAQKSATADDEDTIEALRDAGYTVLETPFDLTDELVKDCRERLDKFLAAPEKRTGDKTKKKLFWASLLKDDDLTPESIFLRYASQERIYRLACMYLGTAPRLTDVSLQYSFAVPDDPTHSQLWHRDYQDTKIFKVFIYCNDVLSEEDGAFHAAHRRAVRPRYNNPLYSSRKFTDQQFSKIADLSKVEPIYGKTGTTFICDTCSSFHFGSRCIKPRLACWFTYSAYASLYPIDEIASPAANSDERLRVLLSPRLA